MSNSNSQYSYQSSRYKDEDINGFDFSAPAQQYKDFQEIINNSYLARKNKHFWQSTIFLSLMTVFVMVLCLGALGYLVLSQSQMGNSIARTLSSKLSSTQTTSVIPAKNFTIISTTPSPAEFQLSKINSDYKPSFLKADSSLTYQYATNLQNPNNAKTGIAITSIDFDYKLDYQSFGEMVAKDFGGDWKVSNNQIIGNKNIKLSSIESKLNPKQIYYTTVTSNYYYIAKVDRAHEGTKDIENVSNYINNLIHEVYFN